ncbi:MAG: Cof-type HAD-IIB family hydrolase [Firmicutes bacterium]|nr:Cof-type HAD-IIB family hydrolase [Bacillota bacterium]
MTIRLLALDLDDTLLNESFHISEQNRAAIQRVAAAGVLVTLATGRMFHSAQPYARELEIDLPLITYHGAMIRTTGGEETLFHRPVPLALAHEVVSIAKTGNFHVNAYLNDELYVAEENENSRIYEQMARVKVNVVGDLVRFLIQAPTKITIVNTDGRLPALWDELKERFSDTLAITISRPHYLEITDRRATKGQALAYLAKLHQIPREQIAAVGDSYNDLDMLEYAGMGVAVANARDEVKAVANVITETNVNHGVAAFIEKYLLAEGEQRG